MESRGSFGISPRVGCRWTHEMTGANSTTSSVKLLASLKTAIRKRRNESSHLIHCLGISGVGQCTQFVEQFVEAYPPRSSENVIELLNMMSPKLSISWERRYVTCHFPYVPMIEEARIRSFDKKAVNADERMANFEVTALGSLSQVAFSKSCCQ